MAKLWGIGDDQLNTAVLFNNEKTKRNDNLNDDKQSVVRLCWETINLYGNYQFFRHYEDFRNENNDTRWVDDFLTSGKGGMFCLLL